MRRKLKELHDAVGKEGGPEEAESARGLIRPLMVALGHEEHEQTRGAQVLEARAATDAPRQGLLPGPKPDISLNRAPPYRLMTFDPPAQLLHGT